MGKRNVSRETIKTTMIKTDLQIEHEVTLDNINSIASKIGIDNNELEPYGKYKAKLSDELLERIADRPNGKLILVTAITPTKAGEGKTTTTIGLADGLSSLGKRVVGALREPSLGPVFGIKGGATGGGYSQVVPMEDINLHFTGDMHAITTANNLISAIIDNHIYQGNQLRIDPDKILWKRCMDMNDRALRQVMVGLGEKNGVSRPDGFNITVASEVMAILCLSADLQDFEQRIKRCVVALDMDGKPVTVEDLKVSGAVAAVMKEALKPNIVQTLEHTPMLIHGGPFANIAHGCNSIIATKTALKLADYVVTEAGFGADLGCEKFVDIKCRTAGIRPDAIVLVITIRALKLHGGVNKDELATENLEAINKGFGNALKHADTLRQIGVPFVLTLNHFYQDTDKEIELVKKLCRDNGYELVVSDGWAKGSKGMQELGKKVLELTEQPNHFTYLYDLEEPFEKKIEDIVKKVYGGSNVVYTDLAKQQLNQYKKYGWDRLPICMAKTPNSLTDNAKIYGAPKDFAITVKELRISAGAGFVVILTGNIMTMPGLPKVPAAEKIGVDENNQIYGLF